MKECAGPGNLRTPKRKQRRATNGAYTPGRLKTLFRMVINVYFTEIVGDYLISMEGAERSFLTSILIHPRNVPVFLSYTVNDLVICFLKNVIIFFLFRLSTVYTVFNFCSLHACNRRSKAPQSIICNLLYIVMPSLIKKFLSNLLSYLICI